LFFLKKVILLWQIVILFSKFAVKLLLMIDKNARVLLIYTGGTIGMVENLETGALEAFNFSHLKSNVPEMKRLHFNVDAYLFDPPFDSSEVGPRK
jgi:L-asparaginase